jgi:glycerol transport system ATP-binding protein
VAYALLGPSGCGKTTLLNIVSGLLQPTAGKVLFDGRDVTRLPTAERNIAQVFQFPVVYDTMTVFDNLAFPVSNRGMSEPDVAARVNEIAETLGLSDVLDRRAGNLGADIKQKIAMGRGLVRDDVAAILFDEPLTAIDPHLKISLRRQLRMIHATRRLTLVYVTHDQTEALTFADRVVVMHAGEVVQVDTPQGLFEAPAHTFVGHFIGSPGMNFLDIELDGNSAVVNGSRIRLNDTTLAAAGGAAGRLQLGIRPDFLQLVFEETPDGVPARVTHVEDLGSHKIVTAAVGDDVLRIRMPEEHHVRAEHGWCVFPPEKTLLFCDSWRVSGR